MIYLYISIYIKLWLALFLFASYKEKYFYCFAI